MSSLENNISKEELESLARCFLPDIIAFFESEDGKREFEAWKQQKEKEEKANQKKIA
jgi:hypothetical protein